MSRVQAIERAFAVLAALADGPVGVTEVAERVHLPKSTVARLLRHSQREGAVEQVPGDTRYRVGERMALLAARATPGATLVSLARPALEELAAEVGEAAGLGVPDGFRVHYIDQADTRTRCRRAIGPARASRCTPSRPARRSSRTCPLRRSPGSWAARWSASRRTRSPTPANC